MRRRPLLRDHALAVYLFSPLTGPAADAGRRRLLDIWRRCADTFGMTRAVPRLGVPAAPPDNLTVARPPRLSGRSPADLPGALPPLLAAAERPGKGVWELVLRSEHDVLCLGVMLAPARDEAMGWGALERAWLEVSGGQAPLLGEVRLLLATHTAGRGRGRPPAALRDAVRQDGAPVGSDGRRLLAGVDAWELPDGDDARSLRRLVVTAAADRQALLARWVWSGDPAGIPWLPRYLMHMAKVRYQLRVHAAELSFRDLGARVDDAAARLAALGVPDEPVPLDRLIAARRELTQVQADSSGLHLTAIAIGEMSRSVEIAEANMAAVLASELDGLSPDGRSPRGLFDDGRVIDWFRAELDDDRHYLQATTERAAEIGRVIGLLIQQRLQEREEEARRRHEWLTLLQTSFLGALVMGLAAIQALTYKLPLPGPIQPPLIATLAALALCLPTVAYRYSPGPAGGRPALAGHAALAVAGGAVGWLAISAATYVLPVPLAAPPWTVAVSALCAAVTVAASAWRNRRVRRAEEPNG
ncbi:CATRA conflict system CASPASE/TPR repeat-associated protein [Nonomuraea sp. NPDC049709]|uniref:CATRA conflict system CASPASE/TPR repeat-associated protein n=1 Tax=Nonomuraea sp. NPDC049709 TaxID=3154736 RepID=UPI0034217F83